MSVLAKGLWMWGFRRSVTVCGPRRSDEPLCSSVLPGLKSGMNAAWDPPAPQGLPIQMLLPCLCCQLSCEPGWPELCRFYLINDILRVLKHNFPFLLLCFADLAQSQHAFLYCANGDINWVFQISLFVIPVTVVGSLPPSEFFWLGKKYIYFPISFLSSDCKPDELRWSRSL